jgi:hypothetical protein
VLKTLNSYYPLKTQVRFLPRPLNRAVEQWPARKAHNLEVVGSNPASATNLKLNIMKIKEFLDSRNKMLDRGIVATPHDREY